MEKIEIARKIVSEASSLVILTGAGISSESGIPTFRGEDGLWKNYRAEDLATPEAFASNPLLVWQWYDWRRQIISKAQPNQAHLAIAKFETQKNSFLITQNVDGLHRKSGSKNLVEMHGCIWRMRCTSCYKVIENYDVPLPKLPPLCECNNILRPDVVWFGEPIPHQTLRTAYESIQNSDVMIIIGTSAVVQPAASMGMLAIRFGKTVIEVNISPTPFSELYNIFLEGKAGTIIPQIL